MNIPRSNSNTFLILENNRVDTVSFLRMNNIDGIIRIRKEEYAVLPDNVTHITHFNLGYAGHKKGAVYALPLIIKPGIFTKEEDIKPILRFENCVIAKCVGCRNNVSYDQIREEDFIHSFPSIKNRDELKQAILRRYTQSMPDLSLQKILSLGVAITELEVMGRLIRGEILNSPCISS